MLESTMIAGYDMRLRNSHHPMRRIWSRLVAFRTSEERPLEPRPARVRVRLTRQHRLTGQLLSITCRKIVSVIHDFALI